MNRLRRARGRVDGLRAAFHDPDRERGERHELSGGFFGGLWIGVAALLVIVGMATSRPPLAVLGLLALASAAVAWGWARLAFRGVVVEPRLSRARALPDDEIEITVVVRNRKPLPVPWLTLELELSNGLTVLGRETLKGGLTGRQSVRLATTLAPFGRLTWRLRVACPARGLHPVGPVRLRAGDPFGFFTDRLEHPGAGEILTFPRVRPIAPLMSPRELAGDARVARQLVTDPVRLAGIRDYQPADPFRSIHWKATARLGTLQVRLEEPVASQRLLVGVNLDTFEHYWEGLDAPLAEHMVSLAASVVSWAVDAGFAVGLVANGLIPGTNRPLAFAPARGVGQRERCLTALARLGLFSTVPFARVVAAEGRRLPPGAALAIITSRLPDDLAQALAALRATGRTVIMVPIENRTE